jgi:hypothetical protein
MKPGRPFTVLFVYFTILLVMVSGCLIKNTVDYKMANRKLILQNDSLRAVIIDLTRKIGATAAERSAATAAAEKEK